MSSPRPELRTGVRRDSHPEQPIPPAEPGSAGPERSGGSDREGSGGSGPPRKLRPGWAGATAPALLSLLVLVWVAAGAGWPGPRWRVAERGLEDQLLRLLGPRRPPPGLLLVAIDDASLQQGDWFERSGSVPAWARGLGSLPWPRAAYGLLIERLLAAGARVVALNVVFEGPSGRGPGDDAALAGVLARHGGQVALAAEMEEGEDRQAAGSLSLVRPADALVTALGGSDRLGLTNLLVPGPGGRLLHPEAYASGLLGAARVDGSPPALSTTALRLAGRADAHDDSHSALRAYGPEGSLPRLSAWEVLDPQRWARHPLRSAVAGAVVLVGPVVNQGSAGYATPFGPLSGLEILGTATANSLAGDGLRPWPSAPPARAVLALLPLLLALAAGRQRRTIQTKLAVLALLAALQSGVGLVALQRLHLWLPLLSPLAGLGALALLQGGEAYLREERERQRLRRTFERYVAPGVVAEILADPDAAEGMLRGRSLAVTVLMCDLRGFTALTRRRSEAGQSELHVRQLNDYLGAMVEVVNDHGGTIDKFIGDAVMAVFGSPVSRGAAAEARQAARCALAMRAALLDLNADWRQRGLEELDNGVGLASGPVVAGQIGSPRRLEFTVIGDTVNRAARLEAATRQLEAAVVCDAATATLLAGDGGVAIASLGEREIKGMGPLELFGVVAPSASGGAS